MATQIEIYPRAEAPHLHILYLRDADDFVLRRTSGGTASNHRFNLSSFGDGKEIRAEDATIDYIQKIDTDLLVTAYASNISSFQKIEVPDGSTYPHYLFSDEETAEQQYTVPPSAIQSPTGPSAQQDAVAAIEAWREQKQRWLEIAVQYSDVPGTVMLQRVGMFLRLVDAAIKKFWAEATDDAGYETVATVARLASQGPTDLDIDPADVRVGIRALINGIKLSRTAFPDDTVTPLIWVNVPDQGTPVRTSLTNSVVYSDAVDNIDDQYNPHDIYWSA